MLESALSGLTSGGAYAILGVVIVLLHRMVGVVDFSVAAFGAFGTYVMLTLYGDGWAYGSAALVGVLAAAALSAVAGAIMARWFFDAGTEVKSTVSIALLVGLLALGFRLFGQRPRPAPTVLDGRAFTLGEAVVTKAAVVSVLGAVALAAGAGYLLTHSRTGLRLQAMSERPRTAELLGIPARALAVAVWAVSGMVAALACMVVAPTRPSDFFSLSLLVLPALAAALVGIFRHTGAALAGGVAIGLVEGLATRSESFEAYRSVVPFLVILVLLLWSQRKEQWDVAR